MKDQFNLLCPYCSLCIKDNENKPCCSLYAKRLNSFDTAGCLNFTSNKELLRRQRWQIAKLIFVASSFIALLIYLLQTA